MTRNANLHARRAYAQHKQHPTSRKNTECLRTSLDWMLLVPSRDAQRNKRLEQVPERLCRQLPCQLCKIPSPYRDDPVIRGDSKAFST
eukprot:5283547-Amphidinium_carterae.1